MENEVLYKDFDFNILNNSDFGEDAVREELVNPILKRLGYRASGIYKINYSKHLEHPFVKIGSGEREIKIIPDYLLEVQNKYAWVFDAKAPTEKISTGAHREQVYFYAIHPDIRTKIYALCNGKELIVFPIDGDKPMLYFQLSEIEKHWAKIEEFLSPHAFELQADKIEYLREAPKQYFTYLNRPLLPELPVRKQAAKRHFGVHGYFTTQAWNVVQEYIKNFSRPGDLILDPYGGSGVTLIESIVLGRKAIHLDINPLANFIVKNLIEPVNLASLLNEFEKIKIKFDKNCPKSDKQIRNFLKKYSFPKGMTLMKNADVDTIEELFTKKQLAQLAYLKHLIKSVKDKDIKNSLLLAFSSTLTKINRTYHPSSTRGINAGDCAAFRYYRFRLAKEEVDLDIMDTFEWKFKKLISAKKEMVPLINKDNIKNAIIEKGTATDLKNIESESIDYIYTDPPYGSKIPYLDLSVMWNAWLDLGVTNKDYKLEAIEGGEHNKTAKEYSDLLALSIKEMYRVLKFDRWMSFVFAHKDPKYWHHIVDTAERCGFEYAGAVKQRSSQSSFKKRQNPFSVLSGQLIINFKKVQSPEVIQRVNLGTDVYNIIIETIESTIAKNNGATLEEINDELTIRGLELGFLDLLSKEYKNLTPLLLKNFKYDDNFNKFLIKEENKFKTKIDVNLRIRYFLISFLKRCELEKKNPTIDEIILHIMPLLRNGLTPENQTILNVLKTIATHVGKDCWKLRTKEQLELFI